MVLVIYQLLSHTMPMCFSQCSAHFWRCYATSCIESIFSRGRYEFFLRKAPLSLLKMCWNSCTKMALMELNQLWLFLICVHKKCVTKYYRLKLYNRTAVNKFCSRRCDKQVLIKYFMDIKMELKEIVVTDKNWRCYKNNKLFAKSICC